MPETLDRFKKQFSEVWEAYEDLRDSCDNHGPLDRRTVELIKIAVSSALNREGGVVAHVSQARKAGASPEEIHQAILITMALTGFPVTLASLSVATKYLEGS